MTTKIAAADATAMAQLITAELTKAGVKTAVDKSDANFKDHSEYISVLEAILSDDKKESWKPNDPKLD